MIHRMIAVESSAIDAIGYDSHTRTLRVRFKGSGATWEYDEVTEPFYVELMTGPSIGSFFMQRIKGHFTERKVEDADAS